MGTIQSHKIQTQQNKSVYNNNNNMKISPAVVRNAASLQKALSTAVTATAVL
jgi:hypothetical protein